MVRQIALLLMLLVGGMMLGCDNRQKQAQSAPATRPSEASATTQPDESATAEPTTAPATQPAFSMLTIDGQEMKFPPAQIRVDKSGGRVVVHLYSVDPKSALRDDYRGNSYYLKMTLDDVHDPHLVYLSQWQYKARSHEFVDSPYGIFLDGMQHQLQPADAAARFMGSMFWVRVDLEGEFLQFDSSEPQTPPRLVHVKGALLAPVEYTD